MGKPIGMELHADKIAVGEKVNIGGYGMDYANGVISKVTKEYLYIDWNDGRKERINISTSHRMKEIKKK